MNAVIAAIGFGLVDSAILALAAVGFTIQFGVSNIFNLAYAQTMTVCAFVAYALNQAGINIWLAMALAAVAGAVLSAMTYFGLYAPFLRRGGGIFPVVMVSLAVSIALTYILLIIFGAADFSFSAVNGALAKPIHIGSIVWTVLQVILMAITGGIILVLYLILRYTRIGKALRATAGDAELARHCGIDTRKIMMVAWLVSGFLCGLGGVEYALNTNVFSYTAGGDFLLLVFAAAALGGIGEINGALVGALIIGLSIDLTAIVIPNLKEVAAFAALLLILVIRPRGLFGAEVDPDVASAL